jgi:hypothetical protein
LLTLAFFLRLERLLLLPLLPLSSSDRAASSFAVGAITLFFFIAA